jgi:hypothetical protein
MSTPPQFDFLEFLSNGSPRHAAKKTDNGLVISAPGGTLEELQRFQPLARYVIEREGQGYAVLLKYVSGELYREIVLEYLPG